jgi:anti-sigma28 factor (negative regulator of flagellin synthesis)
MASIIQGVNGVLPNPLQIASANRTSSSQAATDASQAAPVAASSATSGDGTDLSALSALLADAVATASAQSPVRPPIVSAIKAQIAAGMYGPALSDIAAAVASALVAG